MIFFNLPTNPFFINFLDIFFMFFFLIYIKLSKKLSGKYYLENKDRLQKKGRERYQDLSKKKEKKKQ